MSDLFWKYPVTCDAACHAQSGVGPATDYAVPYGTPIHAPFSGQAQSYWTDEGGWGIRVTGEDEIFCGQHLAERAASGYVNHRDVVATSGNSGSATTGPHIHAYIIIKATGERVSFQKWYEDILPAQGGGSSPTPTPPADEYDIDLNDGDWYWYRSAADAQSLQNVHGGRYTGESMVGGGYRAYVQPNGALKIHSNANGWVYLNSQAAAYRV